MVQGSTATGEKYKPTEHKGRREDNQPDKRTQQNQFAYGKVDPHEAGHEGGKVGGHAGGVASGKGSASKYNQQGQEQLEDEEPEE
ncbi:uncharacterized protein DSM5745_01272 [Aspergillus mulundensis]|uniref:Uncharacterized protein n=1 Tax=Aspergillus mulundensis TaxID=1810919 RepID=A0A3D8T5Z9_9EURO|nr:Uncharacterized protein DSM5745_01272 [Aspergillus mulundensis]RDW93950.1 Uncharacterized protein DSM5745_01272 [Aspergillus mulundensis]